MLVAKGKVSIHSKQNKHRSLSLLSCHVNKVQNANTALPKDDKNDRSLPLYDISQSEVEGTRQNRIKHYTFSTYVLFLTRFVGS